MFVYFFTFISFFCTTALNGEPAAYPFAQQFNATCLMVPVINIKILHDAKEVQYDFSKLPHYQRVQWLGILHPNEIAWFKPFSKINYYYSDPLNNDEKALKQYLDEGIAHGPVLPHFYDKNGNFPFGGMFKGTDEVLKFLSLPATLVDFNAAERMNLKIILNLVDIAKAVNISGFRPSLVLPVLQEKTDKENNIIRIFNEKTMQYEPQKMDSFISSSFKVTNAKNIEEDHHWLNLHKNDDPQNLLAFSMGTYSTPVFGIYTSVGVYVYLGQGYQPTFEKCYAPFNQGVYKMMLLTLGVGHENEVLAINGKPTKNKDTYGELSTIVALQNICNEDQYHPWNGAWFHKEEFLPYVIAEILKNNDKLANQLKQTINFKLNGWDQYQKLIQGDYYNQAKEQMTLKSIGKFIPGEEQVLAYLLMESVRFLWYGSHNPEVFYNWTIPKIPLIWSFDQFKTAAQKKKIIKNGMRTEASFLDTWRDICTQLFIQDKRRNWISFDGHGWVISFVPEIIKKERALSNKFYDATLNEQLGFAGIESILTDELFLFYKTKPQAEDKKNMTVQDKKNKPKPKIEKPQEKPTAPQAAGYKTFNESLQEITKAHAVVFSVHNLLETGISASSENDWNNALRGVFLYVQNILDAPRSLGQGISSKNKTLIMNAMNTLQDTSRAIINSVNSARGANFNFQKDAYANINVNNVNEQIAKLSTRVDILKTIQNDLKPLFADALYTKDAKNILIKVAFILELTVRTVQKNWDTLKTSIKHATKKQ